MLPLQVPLLGLLMLDVILHMMFNMIDMMGFVSHDGSVAVPSQCDQRSVVETLYPLLFLVTAIFTCARGVDDSIPNVANYVLTIMIIIRNRTIWPPIITFAKAVLAAAPIAYLFFVFCLIISSMTLVLLNRQVNTGDYYKDSQFTNYFYALCTMSIYMIGGNFVEVLIVDKMPFTAAWTQRVLAWQVVDPALEVHRTYSMLFMTCSLIGMFFITALLVQIFSDTYSQAASTTFSSARIMHWGAIIPAFAMLKHQSAGIASEVKLNLASERDNPNSELNSSDPKAILLEVQSRLALIELQLAQNNSGEVMSAENDPELAAMRDLAPVSPEDLDDPKIAAMVRGITSMLQRGVFSHGATKSFDPLTGLNKAAKPSIEADVLTPSVDLNIGQFEQLLLLQAGDSACSHWLDTVSTQVGSVLEDLRKKLKKADRENREAQKELRKQYQPVFAALATLCGELQNEKHYQMLASLECINGTDVALHKARRNMSLAHALVRCGLADEDLASQLQFIKSELGPISDGVAFDTLVTTTVPFDIVGQHDNTHASSIESAYDLEKCKSVISAAIRYGHVSTFMHTAEFLGHCEWLPATESITVKEAAIEWHQLEMLQRLRQIAAEVHGLDVTSKEPVTCQVVVLLQMVQLHKWRLQLMFRSLDQVAATRAIGLSAAL